jgi:subtilase family serine protease
MPDIAATLSASLLLTVPATTVGTHIYSVVIDPQNLVVEGSKANNQATVPVTVQPVAPG